MSHLLLAHHRRAERHVAADATQAEWDRWYAALEQHERGHIDATAWIFDNMDDTMIGLTPTDAQGQFGKFVYDAQQASDRYDADTNHVWNSPRARTFREGGQM